MVDDPKLFMIALVAAICIGVSKAGFSGISMVSVVLLAEVYGARASVGLALPLLIAADLMAYPAFLKHGSWKPVWKLLPATLVGLGLGWWLLGKIDDQIARRIIGSCVLLMVLIQAFRKMKPVFFDKLAESRGLGVAAGAMGGFATMLANAAGPVIQLYFLARRLPKMEMIGIGARFFLLVNLIKIPLNARLALITPDSSCRACSRASSWGGCSSGACRKRPLSGWSSPSPPPPPSGCFGEIQGSAFSA
jgi:uncharacterized membrane protein YfcA